MTTIEDDEPVCEHERAKPDDVECPDCWADMALLDDVEE